MDTWRSAATNTGTPVSYRKNSHKDTHAGHYYHQDKAIYSLEKSIPIRVFTPECPENPQTFGEHLRKERIDAGLQIKELAAEIGVTQDSVINWELRGMTPRGWRMDALKRVLPGVVEGKRPVELPLYRDPVR